jgi:uncharacterized protein (TIGR02594 family)
MASITREQFVSSFQGRSIDVANLSPEVRKDLAAAGITAAELKQIAGADGIIQGGDELGKLFKEIDNLDRDGSYKTVVTSDANGKSTQAGELIADLRAEVEKSRLGAPVSTAKTPTPPSPALASAAKPATTATGKQDPTAAPWLDVARGEIGQKEDRSKKTHNSRIVEYHGSTTGNFKNDETAWCSSFVNWVMEQAGPGKKGTDSARAISWKNYGTKADGPVVGSIAVIDYGNGKGHVGFVVGRSGDNVVLLGGNQKNQVMERAYPKSAITEYRLPPGYQPPAGPLPEIDLKNKKPMTYAETR